MNATWPRSFYVSEPKQDTWRSEPVINYVPVLTRIAEALERLAPAVSIVAGNAEQQPQADTSAAPAESEL